MRDHVLLIGIDAYQGDMGAASLFGCVNDVDAIQRILLGPLGVPPTSVRRLVAPRYGVAHETVVPSRPPTLENIREALSDLGSEAVAEDDRVFIFYSGHGTQCAVTFEGGPTFHREALLPADHAGHPRRYLFDWEINAALRRIAARTRSVTFVFDCCCAAGATRSGGRRDGGRDRFYRSSARVRISGPSEPTGRGGLVEALGSVADCQVVAACLEDERAREAAGDGDGREHGELTRAFVAEIAAVDEPLRSLPWGKIWRSLVARVEARSGAQHPWMFGSFARPVFGGPPAEGDAGIAVSLAGPAYEVGAGTLAGVTEGAVLSIYDATPATFPPIGSADDAAANRGRSLRVTSASRARSVAVSEGPAFPLPAGARARLVRAGAPAKLCVRLEPHDDALAAAITRSPLLRVAEAAESADVTLVRVGDGHVVVDDVHGDGRVPQEPALPRIGERDALVPFLEHYYGYARPLRMARLCTDAPGALRIGVLAFDEARAPSAAEAQSPRFDWVTPGPIRAADSEATQGELICFRVDNAHGRADLHVTLLDCQASGSVQILGARKIRAGAHHVFYLGDDLAEPFAAYLEPPQRFGVDRLVAIGTTSPTDLRYLAQPRSFRDVLEAAHRGDRERDLRGRGTGAPELWTAAILALELYVP